MKCNQLPCKMQLPILCQQNIVHNLMDIPAQMCQSRLHEREDQVAEAVLGALLPGQFGGHGGISLQPLCVASPEGLHNVKAGRQMNYIVGHPLSRNVLFSFGNFSPSSSYQLGCTVAAVTAQQPVEHIKTAQQNIRTEWTPHNVHCSCTDRLSKEVLHHLYDLFCFLALIGH